MSECNLSWGRDGASDSIRYLMMPCGCHWAPSGESLLRVCDTCLTEAASVGLLRLANREGMDNELSH